MNAFLSTLFAVTAAVSTPTGSLTQRPDPSAAHQPVTVTQIDGLARRAFAVLDRDKDDQLSSDELTGMREGFPPEYGWALDILDVARWARSDRDRDGLVSSYEIAERYRTRLEDFDRNGDGTLTHQEWRLSPGEDLRHACISAPDCEEVEKRQRAHDAMLEQRGRAFQRLDWSARSYYRLDSGLDEPLYTAIRDYHSWHALWDRIVSRRGPRPASPGIDFSRDMLLVAAMGSRPTGGYAIQIVSVRSAGDEIVVTVVRTSPGKRCGVTAALTEPADLVTVQANDKRVRWVFEDRVSDCA